jgi:hypothetical protein
MSLNNQLGSLQLGFLTVFSESNGFIGGYLVTNSWGRPLEFRLSTAVQPNRIQQILYGRTLTEYLCADLIGKTLIDKTATPIQLLFTDSIDVLPIRSRLEIPVLGVLAQDPIKSNLIANEQYEVVTHPSSPFSMIYLKQFEADEALIREQLDRIDAGLDVSEPFARIREAMTEARKLGVTNRGSSSAA